MANKLSSEIADIATRMTAAQEAAETGNTSALEEALSEASRRITELLKEIEIEGRGNQATRIQNTDV